MMSTPLGELESRLRVVISDCTCTCIGQRIISRQFHDVRVKVSSFSYIVAHVLIVPVPPFNALAGTLLSE